MIILKQKGVVVVVFFNQKISFIFLWKCLRHEGIASHPSCLNNINDLKIYPELLSVNNHCVWFIAVHLPNTLYGEMLSLRVNVCLMWIYAFGVTSGDIF